MYSPNFSSYELPSMLSQPAFWGSVVLLATLICVLIYAVAQRSKRASNCGVLNGLLPPAGFGSVVDDVKFSRPVGDYTIKSAYNACATGNFKNDYVDLCALSNAIRQGCRFLDFEIYCIDDEAVVAVSDLNVYTQKGSYNYLPIDDVLHAVANQAFTAASGSDVTPNPTDPLFLHFRIKSQSPAVMTSMANAMRAQLSNYWLGSEYNYCSTTKNVMMEPLNSKNLSSKVVIVADMSNTHIVGSDFYEFVNLGTNTSVARLETYNDVIYTADSAELITFNKTGITVCIPNVGASPANNDASVAFKFGVQICAMSFQTNDANLAAYNALFEEGAFIVKPPDLLLTPVTVEVPPPAGDASGYNTYSGRNFSFNM